MSKKLEQQEPAEMEDWMITWKTEDRIIDRLNYTRTLFRRRGADLTLIATFLIGAIGFGWIFVRAPTLVTGILAAFFVPYFLWMTWMVWERINLEISSLPKSSREFLDMITNNLVLRERENAVERKTFPLLLIGVAFVIFWQSSQPVSFYVYLVWPFLLSVAIWSVYWSKPKSLLAERAALEKMQNHS